MTSFFAKNATRFAITRQLTLSRRFHSVNAMSSSTKVRVADRVKDQKPSVWVEFIQLALDYKPLNLGQGFPDFAAPDHVTKALSDTALSDNYQLNQYTRGFGHPRLVNAIAKLYSNLTNHAINPQTEVLVTVGAYEALYCAILGLVNEGDEVIIMEPFFDCYEPMTKMAGGVPVFVPLRPKKSEGTIHSRDWVLDPKEFESKFSSKTKLVIVNTPHNPLGKVFTYDELDMISKLCIKYDCLVVMDEVYEWIVFDDNKHIRMNTLPEMWNRTITIGSAGKTFSVTGWKLGWAYGPEELIKPLQMLHQNCVYTCATPIQEAVAIGFETEIARMNDPTSYWSELSGMLQQKRDVMAHFLEKVQMSPTIPEGGYFMLADFSKLAQRLDFSSEKGETKDYRFVKWLSKNKKLQGIPPSAFYCDNDKHIAENFIRFCFFKKDETLQEAEKIINDLQKSLQ